MYYVWRRDFKLLSDMKLLKTKNHLILVLAMTCLLLIMGLRVYSNLEYAKKVTFQEYAPNWLPEGVRVGRRTVDVERNLNLNSTDISLDFLMSNSPESSFYEAANNRASYTCHYPGESCRIVTTAKGNRYMISAEVLPNNIQDQSIEIYKNGTDIYMNFQGEANQPYAQSTLDKIVDSFTPVHYMLVSGHTSTSCGCGG